MNVTNKLQPLVSYLSLTDLLVIVFEWLPSVIRTIQLTRGCLAQAIAFDTISDQI